MIYSSQTGHGIKDFFRKLTKPIMKLAKPVLDATVKPVLDIGVNLAGELIQDVIGGKPVKASIKARGKQFGKQAGQQALQSTIQTIAQGGRGKRKRSQTPSRSVKRKQTGGIVSRYPSFGYYPPGYYPGPLSNNISTVTGAGKKRKKQTGAGKKKPKKQTGAGKKRKPRKQTGAGKKRKPRKQTGAGKKRKQKKRSDIFG